MKDIFREHEQQLESIILHYGEEHQKEKAEEEMVELRAAICAKKGEDVAEEIADVYIMLAQMMLIYDIPLYLIDSLVKYKLDRTIYRITQEEKAVEEGMVAIRTFEEKAADTAMAAIRTFEEKNTIKNPGWSTLDWKVEPIPNTSEKCIVGKLHGTDGTTEDIKIRRAAPLTKEEKADGTNKEL